MIIEGEKVQVKIGKMQKAQAPDWMTGEATITKPVNASISLQEDLLDLEKIRDDIVAGHYKIEECVLLDDVDETSKISCNIIHNKRKVGYMTIYDDSLREDRNLKVK
jgi:hypothetical protein